MRGSGALLPGVVALALAVAACGGPSDSSSPSGTPAAAESIGATAAPSTAPASEAPSAAPPATPTAIPTPEPVQDRDWPELIYVNRFVMQVAVSDLNVRDRPSTSARSNGKAPKGGLFMMWDWPKQANGYQWYFGYTLLTPKPGVLPDLPTAISTGYDDVLSGWMATGTEDAPFLLPLAPRCPTTADLLHVAAMIDSERISCFAADALTLEGRYDGEGCGGEAPGTFEPAWLASPLECSRLDPPSEDVPALYVHFPPGGPGLPPDGARVRVRGHFSDERSTSCRITELGTDGALSVKIDNDAAAQWCRGKFVVDNYEVIG